MYFYQAITTKTVENQQENKKKKFYTSYQIKRLLSPGMNTLSFWCNVSPVVNASLSSAKAFAAGN